MSTSSGQRHRISWGAKAFMAAMATTVVLAPSASAGGINMHLTEVPTGYVVGTDYIISMSGDGTEKHDERIVLTDNGQCFAALWRRGSADSGSGTGFAAKALSAYWTPTSAGTHTITATTAGSTESRTVTAVAAPAGTPPPAATDPNSNGCDNTTNPFGSKPSTGSF